MELLIPGVGEEAGNGRVCGVCVIAVAGGDSAMDHRGGTQPLWAHPWEKAAGGGHQSRTGLWLLPIGMAGT